MHFTKKLINNFVVLLVFCLFCSNLYAKDPVITDDGFLIDEETFVKYLINQPLELKSMKSKVNLQTLINKSLEEKIIADDLAYKKQIEDLQPTWWMKNKFYIGLIIGTVFVFVPTVALLR